MMSMLTELEIIVIAKTEEPNLLLKKNRVPSLHLLLILLMTSLITSSMIRHQFCYYKFRDKRVYTD